MTPGAWAGLVLGLVVAGLVIWGSRRESAAERRQREEFERTMDQAREEFEHPKLCGDTFFGHACTLPVNHKQDRHEHKIGRSVLTWLRRAPEFKL